MSLVNNPVMGINFRKNTNQTSAGYGRYYPVVDRLKTLSTRGFAQHMINHGSKYGLEDIQAILTQMSKCLPELLAMGMAVKLDGLGIFEPTAEAKKGVTKAEMASVSPREVVKAIHIRFQPDTTKLDDLSGKAFADRCSLELRNVVIVDTVKDAETGKLVERLRTLVPISTFLSDNWEGVEGNTSGGNGGSTPPDDGPANAGTDGD